MAKLVILALVLVIVSVVPALAKEQEENNPIEMVISVDDAKPNNDVAKTEIVRDDTIMTEEGINMDNAPLKCAEIFENCFRTPCCKGYYCSVAGNAICILNM